MKIANYFLIYSKKQRGPTSTHSFGKQFDYVETACLSIFCVDNLNLDEWDVK